jgi:hypothetical protein
LQLYGSQVILILLKILNWSHLHGSQDDPFHLHGSQYDLFIHKHPKLITLFFILIPSFILSFIFLCNYFFLHKTYNMKLRKNVFPCLCIINLVKRGQLSSLNFYPCFQHIFFKIGKTKNTNIHKKNTFMVIS